MAHGAIDILTDRRVAGWYAVDMMDESLELELLIDGRATISTVANRLRNDVKKAGYHQTGRCGFEFQLNGVAKFPPNSEIAIRAKGSQEPAIVKRTPEAPKGYVPPRNDRGELYTINKNGDYSIKFRDRLPDWKTKQLKAITEAEKIFSSEFSLDTSIAYGTLLGLTRDGDFIPHDDDVDLLYISQQSDNNAIGEETEQICGRLRDLGFAVQKFSHGQFLVYFMIENEPVGVEFFSAWFSGDAFFLNFAVAGQVKRSEIYPLNSVKLDNFNLPSVASPGALLSQIYGPSWKVPDPAFRWKIPPSTKAIMASLDIGLLYMASFWDFTYDNCQACEAGPSDFAAYCCDIIQHPSVVYDFGCGQGDDLMAFHHQGHECIGLDYSSTVIRQNKRSPTKSNAASFYVADFYDKYVVKRILNFSENLSDRRVFYLRNIIECMRSDGDENLFEFLRSIVRDGDRIFIEFISECPAGNDLSAWGYIRAGHPAMNSKAVMERMRSLGFFVETALLDCRAYSDRFPEVKCSRIVLSL